MEIGTIFVYAFMALLGAIILLLLLWLLLTIVKHIMDVLREMGIVSTPLSMQQEAKLYTTTPPKEQTYQDGYVPGLKD